MVALTSGQDNAIGLRSLPGDLGNNVMFMPPASNRAGSTGRQSAPGVYTLGDLLTEPQLGLELLAGGDAALAKPLLGAHSLELEHPAKWLDSGWMMLTMGVRLRNKPQLQRDLIGELQELGASCLGFGVGLSFKGVPVALLDEAVRRNFPVVLVPEETQFRDIAQAVFHSTVGVESTTFQRLSSLQQNLIRTFADANPLESIVQRLGRLAHSTVAVISLDGEVDAATGALPVGDIAAALAMESGPGIRQLTIGEWGVVASPVDTSHRSSARWLVMASKWPTASQEFLLAAVQVCSPLIDALLRLSVTRRGQDRAIGQALLDTVLDDKPLDADTRTVGARISALGVDFASDFRTIVLRERAGLLGQRTSGVAPAELDSWLHARLDALGAHYLLARRADEAVVLLESGLAGLVSGELVERWPALRVGLGRVVDGPMAIRTSHRDAQIAVQYLSTLHTEDRVQRFEELDVVTQLLAEVPVERFAATAAPIAALLRDNPIQLEALRAYFAMNRDIKAAADSIFLHPNTLRYRLERLEHALGRSLREPAVTASLHCVLTLLPDLDQAVAGEAGQLHEGSCSELIDDEAHDDNNFQSQLLHG